MNEVPCQVRLYVKRTSGKKGTLKARIDFDMMIPIDIVKTISCLLIDDKIVKIVDVAFNPNNTGSFVIVCEYQVHSSKKDAFERVVKEFIGNTELPVARRRGGDVVRTNELMSLKDCEKALNGLEDKEVRESLVKQRILQMPINELVALHSADEVKGIILGIAGLITKWKGVHQDLIIYAHVTQIKKEIEARIKELTAEDEGEVDPRRYGETNLFDDEEDKPGTCPEYEKRKYPTDVNGNPYDPTKSQVVEMKWDKKCEREESYPECTTCAKKKECKPNDERESVEEDWEAEREEEDIELNKKGEWTLANEDIGIGGGDIAVFAYKTKHTPIKDNGEGDLIGSAIEVTEKFPIDCPIDYETGEFTLTLKEGPADNTVITMSYEYKEDTGDEEPVETSSGVDYELMGKAKGNTSIFTYKTKAFPIKENTVRINAIDLSHISDDGKGALHGIKINPKLSHVLYETGEIVICFNDTIPKGTKLTIAYHTNKKKTNKQGG